LIDAGDNNHIPNTITEDLAGNNRIQNSVVDLGAYEFNGMILSTNNYESNSIEMTLYPNPAKNLLNLESEHLVIEQASIFDINGRLVKSFYQKSTDVSSLAKGVYVVKAISEDGKSLKPLKFVKQ
jgi:hypothetical protein